MNKTYTRMWRWSLLSVLILGGYWLGYFLINGFVPPETIIGFWTNSLVLFKLNVAVSRWFDILIGPIWLSSLIFWIGDTPTTGEAEVSGFKLRDWFEVVSFIVVCLGFIDAVFLGIVTGLVTTIISVVIAWLFILFCYVIWAIVNWANAK